MLACALKTKEFSAFKAERVIGVDNNADVIQFAVHFLLNHLKLKHFEWSCSGNASIEELRQLILGGINGHPSLETIRLSGCVGESVNGYDTAHTTFVQQYQQLHLS